MADHQDKCNHEFDEAHVWCPKCGLRKTNMTKRKQIKSLKAELASMKEENEALVEAATHYKDDRDRLRNKITRFEEASKAKGEK